MFVSRTGTARAASRSAISPSAISPSAISPSATSPSAASSSAATPSGDAASARSRAALDPDSRPLTVRTEDGVTLAVRVFGSADAPLTLVFTHGHCLHTESWSLLCARLRARWGEDARMICYDHRGHGESGEGHPATYTIDQLAHDLDAVLRAVAPTGPIVLVGHSMGAMVLLAYSRLFAESIGTRVVGVGLIAGAATGLTDIGLGRFLHRYTVTSLQTAIRHAPRAMQASKRLSRHLFEPLMREASAGTRTISPRLLAVATTMLNETPLLTMTGFLTSLIHFDEIEGLHRLGAVPTLVLAGSADIVVPFAHSVVLASQLGDCELVRVEGGSHSVIGEYTEEVAGAIARLVARTRILATGEVGGTPGFAIAG
ncbi:alpha/beta fold hydrolase [Nocardia shimofusensis]|uniref:alpha/beta fold hydrolase n=1 Tax=Nocardia shimofusensis TaxID=228596 RepID=UPI000A026351|nr:alpha/beta hydrolase [Nocardia shimofusensis]